MANAQQVLQRARSLAEQYRHDEAERLIVKLLSEEPSNPDASAELGILYTFTQREIEAVDLLHRASGAERFSELAQSLTDHFHCRALMAKKLGIDDPLGKKAMESVRALAGLEPGNVGIRLSACLIVRNEEAHLERCLASVRRIADEIVVVDTGSTDGTVAIAERFGATIGHFDWVDDFSAARNESLRLATGDWALWIDADEELDASSENGVREALMRPQFGGFYVQIHNLLDESGDANQYVHVPVRLFKRCDSVRFEGRVHEQITPSLKALGLPNATLESVKIRHYGYRPSDMASKDKIQRTVSLIEKELEERPDDPFQLFNLANAQIVARDYASAAAAAGAAVRHLERESGYGSQVYQILAASLIELGRYDEALAACDECDERGFASVLSQFERAHALQRMNRDEDALAAIDRCLAMEWPLELTGDYGIKTHKRQLLKGQIIAQLGRFTEAVELFDFALAHDPANTVALYSKAATLDAMGQPIEALKVFEAGFGDPFMGPANKKGAARVYQRLGQLDVACQLFEEAWRGRPMDHGFWVHWVQCAEAAGDMPAVVRAYEAYNERAELSADMLVNWGRALATCGDHEKGLNCFTEALKRDPTNANAYFNCGDLLYQLGHFADAAHLYESGLRHAPLNADGWFVLGNSLAQMGLGQGAQTAYRQALNINAKHAGAQANLALVEEGMKEQAA
ncbi:MAG: glycosyltransferase [Fimbriimonadaceae bacterium]|nr:glycosyltransferase [Chthonomonadaceae bacterium]MCO5296154.1 glycosyltransferase [Fimbriimonadaceae bacterium]